MTAEMLTQAGIAVAGYVATVATLRANLKGLERRVADLERKHERLPHDYVPRPEVKAQLDAISKTLDDVKGLLQVAIYSGKTPGNHHKHEG